MARALTLARATAGLASPNPQVGCVLVRDNVILGEGAHLYDRFDHAEIAAIKAANTNLSGATAYVTLEPCAHHGRTGPCADALLAAGIVRCVVATVDPNPQVSGSGIARLRAAGVTVELGVLESEARALNDAFAFSITHGRPYVTLKAALSVDGMIAPPPASRAPNQPHWLTGPESRAEVQQLRHASDAILTGIGTVLADDPLLTDRTRLPRRRPLMRVILDSHLRIPLSSRLVQTIAGDLWIFCSENAGRRNPDKFHSLQNKGAICTALALEDGTLPLKAVLSHLHISNIRSVLLEAGPTLNGAFLTRDLVDRVFLFYAETELGLAAIPFSAGGETPFALEQRLLSVTKRPIGPDILVSGPLHNSWSKTPQVR